MTRLESLGAAPAREHAPAGITVRRAAVHAALEDAVLRSALGLLGAERDREARQRVSRALGDDPVPYTVRYRLVEDRGERRRLLVANPEVEWEYVVLVEVHVALDRIRERLVEARLLAPGAPRARAQALRVELLGVRSWSDYRLVRDVLARRGGAVRPVEFSRERVVLEVETDRDARALLRDLRQGLPARLGPVPLAVGGQALRVRLGGPAGAVRSPSTPGAASPRPSGPS